MKKWVIGKAEPDSVKNLMSQCGLSKLCAEILSARGIDTVEKAVDFFAENSDDYCMLSDPFMLKDMSEAAEHLNEAIENGKHICIYGDYDCDGILSTVMLYSYIECMGGNVTYYINDRSEGYGINCNAIKKLAHDGVDLIVTVDNGITAIDEAKLVRELGMELIITDHHQPSEALPEAYAVVNPHRTDCMSPFKDLCGCGVVLKLIAALDGGDYNSVLEQFSDLAAIATIADVVPLKGENRNIVRCGLHYLQNTENVGLQALIETAGIKTPYSSTDAAFMLAPRINASGRFALASEAVQLFIKEDYDEALILAKRLDSYNTQRKKTEAEIMSAIQQHIENNPHILNNRVLVFYGDNWHHGVIGIVAARLLEKFGKPVFVISDDGDEARGSARSVEGFSVFKALSACSELLSRFGGHSGAGGFSLKKENIGKFDDMLQLYSKNEYSVMPVLIIRADKILLPDDLNAEAVKSLSSLEPFGEGNPKPLFAVASAIITDIISLSNGNHTKLKLAYGNVTVFGLLFGTKSCDFKYKVNDRIDLLVYPELNSFNGTTSVILRITEYRKSGISQQKFLAAKEAYEKYKRGEGADNNLLARIIPDRNDLAAIFRAIPKEYIPFDILYTQIASETINYCKFRLALDIFSELELVDIHHFTSEVRVLPVSHKVSLDSSLLLNELNSLK
jgi:single-stranded-DNA-specific exonuclease